MVRPADQTTKMSYIKHRRTKVCGNWRQAKAGAQPIV